MSTFQLTVVTPSGVVYDNQVNSATLRTVSGDIGILKGHANYVAPLAIGAMKITTADGSKLAAIAGGMVRVEQEKTTVLTSSCEWADEIDIERAKRAAERAKSYLENPTELHTEEIAKIKLERAFNRIDIASKR